MGVVSGAFPLSFVSDSALGVGGGMAGGSEPALTFPIKKEAVSAIA